jgi:outer membrane protein
MGMKLGEEIILKDNLNELRSGVPAQLAAQFDASQRLEYQLLETAIRLKGFDMRQKRVQYFPSLYSYLNYGWSAQGETMKDFFKTTTINYPDGDTRKSSAWYDQGLVGLTLKVPIFDSGLKLAQVKQAKVEQMKTANDFENFKNASELQFRSAQIGFNSALIDEANSTRTQELSKKIFDKNTAKFKEGVGSSFELVQSEQDYITNQLRHIQSSLNVLSTKADLDKAMGVK